MLFVSTKQLKKSEKRFKKEAVSSSVKPETKKQKALKQAELKTVSKIYTNEPLPNENLENRKAMLEKVHTEPLDFAYERAIGVNDSVYSNFCELLVLAKKSIGRVVIQDGATNEGYATGFMVSNKLLLTNWHVFKTKADVRDSKVEFNYELDIYAKSLTKIVFRLNANEFYYSNEELDYCLIAVEPNDVNGTIDIKSIGYHYLDPEQGKVGEDEKELLNIIHHPGGDYKQLSIRENTFVKRTPTSIWYTTDTAQGSSGSPVFNDQWQVVALHHMGKAARSADDKHYVDKNGKVIPVVNNVLDVSKIQWIANEGIRVSVILKDVFAKFKTSAIVNTLKIKPEQKSETALINEIIPTPKKQNTMEQTNESINISIPSTLVENGKKISISINGATSDSNIIVNELNQKSRQDEYMLEVLKADKEDAIDFSECEGYMPNFLGVKIAMPKPNSKLIHDIAKLEDKSIELKYFKYSVIFNAVTKMPAISAINVEGDADLRKDNSKRQDDWLKDARIDKHCQLSDKWYAHSQFDKGHMSRWEDANWDDTKKLANRNGVFTCFHTNACPQVLELNRAGGFWGKLENAVLRDGVKKESGKQARVTVFNGPIHKKTDKVFRGVKVPLEFYKIILWLNDSNKLKATAFLLTQRDLVKKINWKDTDAIDEEALDINENEKFMQFQCSLKSLTTATKIDFSSLYKYDTFKAKKVGEEAMLITTEAALSALIKKQRVG